MSGGSLDYVFGRMEAAAEDIAEYLRHVREMPVSDFEPAEFYKNRYSDKDEIKFSIDVKHHTIKRLIGAINTIRAAAIYARRAEWLMSADDGFESFIIRTDEELAALKKEE